MSDRPFLIAAILMGAITIFVIAFTWGYNWRSSCDDSVGWGSLRRFQAEAVANGSGYWLNRGTAWFPNAEFRWGKEPTPESAK